MSVVFQQGQVLGRNDLDIFLTNSSGNPTNVYYISYSIYYVDPSTDQEVRIGAENRIPVNPEVGEYYASLMVPANATPGDYRIRWHIQEQSTSLLEGAVQEFGLVTQQQEISVSPYSDCVQDLIHKMRVLTRDNNPDRNYRFNPPQGEGSIGCYNQVFGYIWTDEEFYEYLEIALWKWNIHPPSTEHLRSVDMLCAKNPSWKAALLWGALVNAAQALVYNWIAEEFSVAPDTKLTVVLEDGQSVDLTIEELYGIVKSDELKSKIKSSFVNGALKVKSVNPNTSEISDMVVSDVMQHHTGDKPSVLIETSFGSVHTTGDHSVFKLVENNIQAIRADSLQTGDTIVCVMGGELVTPTVTVTEKPPLVLSYDLCVPSNENFVLSNGILAHNSYSIGGISLDIEKSSKYEGMKANAEDQWDKLTEAKSRTVKYMRGLKQSKFGVGVRSSFGPAVGRGILSPRAYVS